MLGVPVKVLTGGNQMPLRGSVEAPAATSEGSTKHASRKNTVRDIFFGIVALAPNDDDRAD
jgi:hypothetical protein